MKVVDENGKVRDIKVLVEKIPTKGRPKLVLTEEGAKVIENLAKIGCTEKEIEEALDLTNDTLNNENNRELYRTAFKRGQMVGKQSLRHKQFDLAIKGNVKMLIWLGKNMLGQADKLDTNSNINGDENFKYMKEYMDEIKNGK